MRPTDMGTLFDRCAERGTGTVTHLDRPFDLAPEHGVTYTVEQLANLVHDAAGWLAGAGARRGDRVAVVKENHWDYDLLACAAARIGAVPALISGTLPAETLATLVKRLEPAVLVTTRGVLERARLAETDLAGMARTTLTLDGPAPRALTLDDVRGSRCPGPRRRHDDEPLVINHTSGTTGTPKLVVHSTATIIGALARFEAIRWPLLGTRRTDTVANASSFAHGRPFCWTASVYCLAPKKILVFGDHTPERAEPLLRAHPPTAVEALPSAYLRWQPLTVGQDNPFRDVRLYVSTYDAMHPPTVRTFLAASRRRRPLWMQGWGQTETGPLSFRFLTRKALAQRESRHPTTRDVGRPIPGRTALKVVDPDTFAPVAPGTTGLVFARTKARALGYVGEQDRWDAKVIGPWWNTGDLASISRTGAVRFLDREVDQVPGLSCVELEDVLEDRLPEVIESVVLGAEGRIPLPVLVTADGRFDRTAWQAATRDLPALDEPVALTWDQIPRTGTGKVRRLELLTRLIGRTDRHGCGRWT